MKEGWKDGPAVKSDAAPTEDPSLVANSQIWNSQKFTCPYLLDAGIKGVSKPNPHLFIQSKKQRVNGICDIVPNVGVTCIFKNYLLV